ncbi:hypothetical protein [Mucilaginibacter paludis]|uniref:Uncharacterized protein n=1 Tax=Mucilaginibacter paludis DSM 18603 TaxID=714943 RepID=H1Y6H1_9SPHI|nr:hypothetical protein [Mucilaginibacter paludis]EHQ25815.1 hypothetical protein Mucpa_1658 [Mucilaginibacter paludis DSM 18603]
MATFNLSHSITHTLFQKLTHRSTLIKDNFKLTTDRQPRKASGRQLFKQAATYTANALAEGLKQNLLGADINTEYLTLTARAFIRTYFKAPSNHPQNNNFNNQHLSGAGYQTGPKNFN